MKETCLQLAKAQLEGLDETRRNRVEKSLEWTADEIMAVRTFAAGVEGPDSFWALSVCQNWSTASLEDKLAVVFWFSKVRHK